MSFDEMMANLVKKAVAEEIKPLKESLEQLRREVNPLSSREVFTPKEAGERLGLGADRIRELLNSGKLVGTKDGSTRWRILKDELIRFANYGAKRVAAEHTI